MQRRCKTKQQVDFIINVDKVVQKHLQKEVYTLEEVKAITTTEPELTNAKAMVTQILTNAGADFKGQIEEYRKYVYDQLNYNLNLSWTDVKAVGDNQKISKTPNMATILFWSGQRKGPYGTHVAGDCCTNTKQQYRRRWDC